MLTADNGIITQTLNAKKLTEDAKIDESLQLSVADALVQGVGILKDNNLKEALNSYIGSGKYKIRGDANKGWKITIGEKKFKIDGDGNISKDTDEVVELPETAEGQPADTPIKNPAGYGENAQATADGDGKYFAKPDGATYLEGTVDTGVVVSINESEFVWVPVDEVVLDTDDTDRMKWLPKSEDSTTLLLNDCYTPMAVKVGSDYKGILYEFTTADAGGGYLKYADNENYLGSSSDCREPAIVSEHDEQLLIDEVTLQEEYNSMIESVKKYKGFYVARYEAGLDADNNIVFKDASEDTSVTTANLSNSETEAWYGLYEKIKTFTTSSENLVSSMIWGSQYDAMLNWISKNTDGPTLNIDGSDGRESNGEYVTGANVKDVINNIYDLYGCYGEWTLEASSNSECRTYRGRNGG